MSRWEVRGRWIESHNGIWLIGCSMSCWELEASCTWGKNSHPPSLSAKASKGSTEHTEGVLAPVGCSTSTLLWWKARNEGSENWGLSVFKSNHVPMCWQLLLAQSRGSVCFISYGKQKRYPADVCPCEVIHFICTLTRAVWNQCISKACIWVLLRFYFDWIWGSSIKMTTHTQSHLLSKIWMYIPTCGAVIWNIWLACWRNSWIVLIFQYSKYSCWTVKTPWELWLTH